MRMTTATAMLLSVSSRSLCSGFISKPRSSSLKSLSTTARHVLSPRLDGLDKPTVWHEFSPLANEHKAVNLGQGFPDWSPPDFCVEALQASVTTRNANQYARSYAHMPLAQVLAKEYTDRWGIHIDPTTMVGTAVGCTNALYCALQGLVSPGDQVLLLEPAFDIYHAQVKMAGGVPIYVPLRPTGTGGASEVFQLDMKELEAAITPKTRVLLINTPHNPTGKMFSKTELTQIGEIVLRHPHVTIISDEVYEHIIYEPETQPHISIASLPGMFDRTLTLSSSGKTFSCTGWKVGWAVGPPNLVHAMTAVQQWCNFSAPTPNQDAMAQSLERAREPYLGFDTYYAWLASDYKRKRSLLLSALEHAGMNPICPPGGFFIMADTSHIEFPYDVTEVTTAMPANPMPRDWSMSRWMTKTVGVTAIPPSAFFSQENIPLAKNLLRFAFCKGDDTLLEAHKRLDAYFNPK